MGLMEEDAQDVKMAERLTGPQVGGIPSPKEDNSVKNSDLQCEDVEGEYVISEQVHQAAGAGVASNTVKVKEQVQQGKSGAGGELGPKQIVPNKFEFDETNLSVTDDDEDNTEENSNGKGERVEPDREELVSGQVHQAAGVGATSDTVEVGQQVQQEKTGAAVELGPKQILPKKFQFDDGDLYVTDDDEDRDKTRRRDPGSGTEERHGNTDEGDSEDEEAEATSTAPYDTTRLVQETRLLLKRERVRLRVEEHQPSINVGEAIRKMRERHDERRDPNRFRRIRKLQAVAACVGLPKVSWDANYREKLSRRKASSQHASQSGSQPLSQSAQHQQASESGTQAESQTGMPHNSDLPDTNISQCLVSAPSQQTELILTQASSEAAAPPIEVSGTQATVPATDESDDSGEEDFLVVLPPRRLPNAAQRRLSMKRELLGEAEKRRTLRKLESSNSQTPGNFYSDALKAEVVPPDEEGGLDLEADSDVDRNSANPENEEDGELNGGKGDGEHRRHEPEEFAGGKNRNQVANQGTSDSEEEQIERTYSRSTKPSDQMRQSDEVEVEQEAIERLVSGQPSSPAQLKRNDGLSCLMEEAAKKNEHEQTAIKTKDRSDQGGEQGVDEVKAPVQGNQSTCLSVRDGLDTPQTDLAAINRAGRDPMRVIDDEASEEENGSDEEANTQDDEIEEEDDDTEDSILPDLIDDDTIENEEERDERHAHRQLDLKKFRREMQEDAVASATFSDDAVVHCSKRRTSAEPRAKRKQLLVDHSKRKPAAACPKVSLCEALEREEKLCRLERELDGPEEQESRRRARALWKVERQRKLALSQEELSFSVFADTTSGLAVHTHVRERTRIISKVSKPSPGKKFLSSPMKRRRQAVSLTNWSKQTTTTDQHSLVRDYIHGHP